MKELLDTKGRKWNVNLNLAAAQRIEGCDFSDLTDKEISVLNMHQFDCMDELIRDTSVVFACIWCCIAPQAEKLGVDQDEFGESVSGEVIQNGREVWAEELADFFPEIRTALLKLIKAQRQGVKRIQKRMDKAADLMAEQVDREIDKAIDKAEKDMIRGPMSSS